MHQFSDDYVIEATMDNHGHRQDGKGTTVFDKELSGGVKGNELVTRDFLKKFISFIKSQKHPELTDDTLLYTSNVYSTIRKKAANYDQNKISQPVTVRTLETIIRLATAHAKLRFSKSVDMSDIDIAVQMLNEAIFQEHMDKKKQVRGDEQMEENSDEEEAAEVPVTGRSRGRRDRPSEQPQIVPEAKSNKKPKVDTDEQVT